VRRPGGPAPDRQWFILHWPDSAIVQLLDQDAVFAFKAKVEHRAKECGRHDLEVVVGESLFRALFEPEQFGAMSTILEQIKPPINIKGRWTG